MRKWRPALSEVERDKMNNRIGGTNHILSHYYEQRTTNYEHWSKAEIRLWRNEPLLCKTNPISTVPVGDSGVIYAKKNTKYYEILQNNTKIYSQKVYFSSLFPLFSLLFLLLLRAFLHFLSFFPTFGP